MSSNIFSRFAPLGLAAAIAVTAGVAFAQSTPTLGDKLASGELSQAAFVQLIANTGLSADEARSMTLSDVATEKWADY